MGQGQLIQGGTAAHYKLNARADNTLRAYDSDLKHFLAWGGRLPTTALVLEAYLAEHARVLSPPTLRRRLAALSIWHRQHDYPNPVSDPGVKETMQGISRQRQWQPQRAPALTLDDLRAILDSLDESLQGIRDYALLMMGVLAALRRSELAALELKDVEWVREGLIVTVGRSKTDPTGQGQRRGLCTGMPPYCPAWSLRRWLDASRVADGCLFRQVDRFERVSEHGLSDSGINHIIKQCARRAGLPGAALLSGHSLRAGLCTVAAKLGEPAWRIRKISHHSSDRGLEPYIRDAALFQDNPTETVLRALARRSPRSV
jgi:integrase